MTRSVDTQNLFPDELVSITKELEARDELQQEYEGLLAQLEVVRFKLFHQHTYKAIARRHGRAHITIYNINRNRLSKLTEVIRE